jgi:high-affinity nickel-transport protein
VLGLLAQNAHLGGRFWSFVEGFNINTAGFFLVGVFALTWAVALAVWRFGRIEDRWQHPGPASPGPALAVEDAVV